MLQHFDFGGRKCEIKKSDVNKQGGQGGGRPNVGRGGYQQQQGYGQGGYGGYGGYDYYGGGRPNMGRGGYQQQQGYGQGGYGGYGGYDYYGGGYGGYGPYGGGWLWRWIRIWR